jgi:3-methyladenine DNA glycosylase/8-oxoguanine DNA glycosylase
MRIELSAHPPFSLQQVINSHGWPQLAPFVWDRTSGELRRVERLASGRVVELRFDQTPDGAAVEIDGELSTAEQAEVGAKVQWMLGLEQDFSDFYAATCGEPKLAQAEPQAKGRVLRSPTLFEDVVKTIATTNTTWGGTIRMTDALVRLYGEPLPADPARRAFPTPERLAAIDVDSLRAEVKLGYRAPYVQAMAQSVASGALELEALKHSDLPTPELRQRLLAIRGVGSYAAANLLVILGRYDYVPVDSWAMSQVSREWYDGQRAGEKEVNAAFERWGEWKGLAFWCWDWAG